MAEHALLLDLVMAVLAAFVGGAIAQRLGQPVILGYLVAGVAIGPFTPGPTANIGHVQVLAEIGVAFLMFSLGAEFSIGEMRRLGRVATVGGALQIGATTALGVLIAPALGLSPQQGLFLGALLALSSTVVALRVLMARGELQSLHGRVTLGLLIAQDVAVVPMVVVLPAVSLGGATLGADLLEAAVKAIAVLAGAYVVGVRVAPWALERAAIARSRELFLLGVVSLALGTALVTYAVGLSIAFGAFLAGLVVAESPFRTQVVAEVLPLRDLFASLFFVSVGMLLNPMVLFTNVGELLLLASAAIVGKFALIVLVVVLTGMPGRVAVSAGLAMAQIGEFSFVLARLGIETGALPQLVFDLILGVAVVSIVLTPFLLRAGGAITRTLARAPLVGARFREPADPIGVDPHLRGHAVICGYGRVGRELAQALRGRNLRYLVVDYSPSVVRQLHAEGTPVIYGDASNPSVLEHAHLEGARFLAVLVPDAITTELVVRLARRDHPHLDIVARAVNAGAVQTLRNAGASAVVQPEFEAGIEVIHHALQRFGVVGPELIHATAGRRAAFYRRALGD